MINETVCAVGCLMSSVSMALAGHNISISGASANPGTLNSWLRNNKVSTRTCGQWLSDGASLQEGIET